MTAPSHSYANSIFTFLRSSALILALSVVALSQVTVKPTTLNFVPQLLNTTSPTQYVTLTNAGSTTATLSTPTITGTYPSDYLISNTTCGTTLAAKASCTIGIALHPTHRVPLIATLNLTGGTVALNGGGTYLLVSPTVLNFIDVAIGQAPTMSFTVKNTSSNSVEFYTQAITGPAAADYSLVNPCSNVLGTGSSCTVNIKFTPSKLGTRAAILSLDDIDDPVENVALTGVATNVLITPTQVGFGWQTVGTTSVVRKFTVKNIGANNLILSPYTLGGNYPAGSSNFAIVSDTCSNATLAPGASCTMGATFTPHSNNLSYSWVHLFDNDPSANQPVNLVGYGSQISLSPLPMYFDTVEVGSTQTKSLTVKNNGTTAVTFTSFAVQGANAADFAIATNTCSTLAGGATCAIGVTFSPATDTGSLAGMISMTDNGGGSPQTVSLFGAAVRNLTSISPSAAVAGGASFVLTATGNGFNSSSAIQWNGSALTTTFVSSTQLQATVPASSIATKGGASITVNTPTGNLKVSNALRFMIGTGNGSGYTYSVANQLANHLVADNPRGVIYLSTPSVAGATGNGIAVLDPFAGTINSNIFAGSEPNRLALTDNGQYLYAGINKNSSVQRFLLPSLAKDISIPLGSSQYDGPYYALDVESAPAAPHTIAVDLAVYNVSPKAQGGVVIYDDATPRTTVVNWPYFIDTIQWGSNSTSLYGADSESSGFEFFNMIVNPSGVSMLHDYNSVFSRYNFFIHFDKGTGYVYADSGEVVDPSTGLLAGSFAAVGPMVPDSSLNTAFFIGQTSAQIGSNNWTIESFDMTRYTPVNSIVIPNVAGTPLYLIRWGSNGLAFNTDGGQVIAVVGTFVGPLSAQADPHPLREHVRYPLPTEKK